MIYIWDRQKSVFTKKFKDVIFSIFNCAINIQIAISSVLNMRNHTLLTYQILTELNNIHVIWN